MGHRRKEIEIRMGNGTANWHSYFQTYQQMYTVGSVVMSTPCLNVGVTKSKS